MMANASSQAQEVERAISALRSIPCPTSRDEWWPIMGSAIDAYVPEESIRDWCESGPEFDEADFKSTFRSLARRPRSGESGALFKTARDHGWRDTAPVRIPSQAEREQRRIEAERQTAEIAAKEAQRYEAAMRQAAEILKNVNGDPKQHPYWIKKDVNLGGAVKRGPWPQRGWADALLIPGYDAEQRISTIEAINIDGTKDSLAGGRKRGAILPIKPFREGKADLVVIAEGVATAAAGAESCAASAVASLGASNMPHAGQIVRGLNPSAKIAFVADHDPSGTGLKYARKAAAAVGGVVVDLAGLLPDAKFDAWDVVDHLGLDTLGLAITKALDATPVTRQTEKSAHEPAVVDVDASAQTQSVGLPVSVPPPAGAPKRRTVQVIPSKLPETVDQAEAALVEQCNDIFQRAGIIVRPVQALIDVADGQQVDGVRLSQVNKHHLAERLTGAAVWEKYDARAGDFVPIDCPVKIAETYLARDGSWRLKALAGIIDAPTLRPDGSILDAEGFDNETGLLLLGDQSGFKPIPANPTKQDAQEALKSLRGLIDTFSFVSDHDRSVALSGILTACIRRSLPSAPLHGFSAPTAGSGKSMLVDLASIIACGRQAAVMSQGRDEAEQEKRLASALLAGDQVITVDNATLPIDGDLLCQVLTQQSVRLRVLGASVLRTMPTNAAFFATGNGLLIQGDMTRRALLCSLDPQCERPEQRVFPANPKDVAERNRAALLCDALTILRAFHIAGRPQGEGAVPLGSFEVWSQWVRGALLWLEQDDPVQTMEKARASDPKLEAIVAVMSQWHTAFGTGDVSVKEVISKATEPKPRPDADSFSYRQSAPVRHEFLHDDLREALLTVAGTGGAINSRSLGKWLAANKGRLIALPGKDGGKLSSFRFVQTAARHGVAIWKLEEVKKTA